MTDLHLAASSTGSGLLGDVELDVELRLQRTTSLTATTNEEAVLVGRDLNSLGGLVLERSCLSLERRDDLLDDTLWAFYANRSLVRLCAREAYHARKVASIVRTSSGSDDGADVRAAASDEVPVVLPVNLERLDSGVVEDLCALQQNLLGIFNSLLGTLKLDLSATRRISTLTGAWYVNLATCLKTKLLHLASTGAD
ncbi:hypothetical protein HBI88_046620 [Parastagonospora nodorum]|nr:hypothetical protein HBH52_084970 [Parastagonospora nodorum]KAH5352189.1 hypothetical protein HBI48_155570 [Parastagonospora nodorum]KAH5700980.1 hypothetical protein HBI44_049980 [Parastagonospora nodorum]KAH5817594.1 hypothetical protein HBI96_056770 [Parastagonospora nodorum]KAH5873060.1 hypothetical protein HBI91_065010 [Parastagonospora nodorum]